MEENLGNAPVLAAAGFASQHLAASARLMLASVHAASVHGGVKGCPKPGSITPQSRFSFGSEKNQGKNVLPTVVFSPWSLIRSDPSRWI